MIALLLAGCAGQGAGQGLPAGDGSALVGRTFQSTSVSGYQLASDTTINVAFPEKGKLTADGGCNHLFGEARFEADKLVVSGMGGTEMACDKARMDQDDWLIKFLTSSPTWSLTGDELVLKGSGTELRLTDRKVVAPDKSLTGQRWTVESLIDGEASSSVPQGAQAYLEFNGGKVTGNTGCNTVTGTFSQKDAALTFADVATTRKACPGEQGALERKLLAVLDGEVTVRIEGEYLVLGHKTGQGLRLRATT